MNRAVLDIGTKNLFATLAKSGEKLTFGIEPGRLPACLAARGLSLERDLGAAEYRERYFGEAARTMRGHEFYRVALARGGSPNSRGARLDAGRVDPSVNRREHS